MMLSEYECRLGISLWNDYKVNYMSLLVRQLFELLDGGRVNFCSQFSAKTITLRVYVTKDAKEAIATSIIKRAGIW